MAMTYAAGRRAQLVEGGFRYWVYRHGGSREPRTQHLARDGRSMADWAALPAAMRRPDAILLDEGTGNTLFILSAIEGSSQIVVALN